VGSEHTSGQIVTDLSTHDLGDVRRLAEREFGWHVTVPHGREGQWGIEGIGSGEVLTFCAIGRVMRVCGIVVAVESSIIGMRDCCLVLRVCGVVEVVTVILDWPRCSGRTLV